MAQVRTGNMPRTTVAATGSWEGAADHTVGQEPLTGAGAGPGLTRRGLSLGGGGSEPLWGVRW